MFAQYFKAVISFLRLPLPPDEKNSLSLRGIGAEDDAVQPIALGFILRVSALATWFCIVPPFFTKYGTRFVREPISQAKVCGSTRIMAWTRWGTGSDR